MNQFPEDLLQSFIKMTGMSRSEAERELTKAIHEMTSGPIFKSRTPEEGGKRPARAGYDEDDYPRFLPSDDIKKYTIRVSLKGISPAIWRKFECPSNISLRHLTELIIQLMGWSNAHLNHIQKEQRTFYVPFYQHDPEMDFGATTLYQEDFKLSDILSEKGKTIRFEYDFGDSWQHEIRLSSIDEYKADEPHDIVFKSGRRQCPPEDCGGVWGYQELLELHDRQVARKRLSSEEKERLEWYGIDKDYDPEELFEDGCSFICDTFSYDGTSSTPVKRSHDGNTGSVEEDLESEYGIETTPLYDEVLSIAFRLRELEPWEYLNDSDLYAIRMQDGSELIVATMGYGGESFDIQLYDGQKSFEAYLMVTQAGSLPDFDLLDKNYWASYNSIMFQDPDDMIMLPYEYRHIQQWAKAHDVSINPEHGYPFVQIFRPHLYPHLETRDERTLSRIKEALEAVEWFSRQILQTEDITRFGFKDHREYPTVKGGKVVPLIVMTADGYKVERTKLPGITPECQPVILPDSDYQSLRSLPKKGTQFIRLLHQPGWIGKEGEYENAYTAMSFLCMDKKTKMVTLSDLFPFSDTYEEDVVRQYVNKLIKAGIAPQRLVTDDSRTEAFLRDLCQKNGIILEYSRTRIPQLSEACQYLYDHMRAFSEMNQQ